MIAFTKEAREGDTDVIVFRDKGGSFEVAAGERKINEMEPTLSADGSVFAYTARQKGKDPVAILRENGQTLPITLDAPSFWPRLSEDGRTLTFATVEKQQVVLYKLER